MAGIRPGPGERALPPDVREQLRDRADGHLPVARRGRAGRLPALPLPVPRPAARDDVPHRHADVPSSAPLYPLLPRHGAARALRHAHVARARLHDVHAAVLHPHAASVLHRGAARARGGRDGGRVLAARGRRPGPPAALGPRPRRLGPLHVPPGVERVPLRGRPDRVLGEPRHHHGHLQPARRVRHRVEHDDGLLHPGQRSASRGVHLPPALLRPRHDRRARSSSGRGADGGRPAGRLRRRRSTSSASDRTRWISSASSTGIPSPTPSRRSVSSRCRAAA